MTSVSCRELTQTKCPCVLALLNECTYCTLLQGQHTCNCAWDGDCAYHYYPWNKISVPECNANTIISVIPRDGGWGLVMKADKTVLSLPPGSIVSFETEGTSWEDCPQAILLNSYPEHNLIYLIAIDSFPFSILQNTPIKVTTHGNAFLGYQHLQTLADKHLLILADKNLLEMISPFILSLKNNTKVTTRDIAHPLVANNLNPDVVFLASSENTIKKVIHEIPPSLNGQYVLWNT